MKIPIQPRTIRTARAACLVLLTLGLAWPALGEEILAIGARSVEGRRIGSYEARWRQRTLQEGEWLDTGIIEEKAEIARWEGQDVLRHTQITTQDAGKMKVINRIDFDRATLSPLHLRQTFENGPPQAPDEIVFRFEKTRIAGEAHKGEKSRTFETPTEEPMFYGMTFGLVLAALPLAEGYEAEMPVSMPQMRTGYTVRAKVVGQETYQDAQGKPVTAWVVETEWKDRASGEVSPGGASRSGGAYSVIPRPPKGLPYVPKYINDTVRIEVLQ